MFVDVVTTIFTVFCPVVAAFAFLLSSRMPDQSKQLLETRQAEQRASLRVYSISQGKAWDDGFFTPNRE